jgi:CheY-like chemotaxis protein
MADQRRILVIDDDPIFLRTTQSILEAEGYQVDSAQNGDEGLAMAARIKPDLVLLDVMMDWPLEGVSVSEELLNSADLRAIPVIIVSSIRSSEYRGSFPLDRYLHVDSWLDKPCPPDRLLDEVQETLARHAAFSGGCCPES